MFSLEDAVAHLSVTNPSEILTIKNQNNIANTKPEIKKVVETQAKMDLHLVLC